MARQGKGPNVNEAEQAVIERRRVLVASLRLRGLSLRRISDAMAQANPETGRPYPAALNPHTGLAWSHKTVHEDVQELEKRWREESLAEITEHKAIILASLRDVYEEARRLKDLNAALRALKQWAELVGADEPLKVDLIEFARQSAAEYGLTEEEAIQIAAVEAVHEAEKHLKRRW